MGKSSKPFWDFEGMDEECKVYWKEERPLLMRKHSVKARKRWDAAFGPDWDYDFLLDAMKAKLENMADYFRTLAPIVNGPYYSGQMALAAKLVEIIKEEGGRNMYRYEDSDEVYDWFTPEDFIPRVNMRNAERFPAPHNYINFHCEQQRVRFCKAWNLLLRILTEKMFIWSD